MFKKIKIYTEKVARGYTVFKARNNNNLANVILDVLVSLFISVTEGIRIAEQKLYNVTKLSVKERKELFYIKDNVHFIKGINDESLIYLFRKKNILLERLKVETGRRYLYTQASTYDALLNFILNTSKFVIKPNSESSGEGIEVITVEGDNLIIERNSKKKTSSIETLAKKWLNEDLVLEEFIIQHDVLNAIYPLSVNSIRLTTVNINNNVDVVLQAMIRFGSNNGNIDFDQGLSLLVDPTGRMSNSALQVSPHKMNMKIFTKHPDTGVLFGGVQIPYWEEALQLVIKAAKEFPEICYVGWDVAISQIGPVVIEGNAAPASFSAVQSIQVAIGNKIKPTIKQQMEELFKTTLFRKGLTSEKIEEINKNLFIQSDQEQYLLCSHVIILGSYACEYRVERAYQLFGFQPVTYIVCGANKSAYVDKQSKHLTESEFLQHSLIEYGVLPEKILQEKTSTNTQENIDKALAILANSEDVIKVGIVTGGFHMRRVKQIIEQCRISNEIKNNIVYIPAYGNNTRPDNWYKSNKGAQIIVSELDNELKSN